jgi:hypothetical protein
MHQQHQQLILHSQLGFRVAFGVFVNSLPLFSGHLGHLFKGFQPAAEASVLLLSTIHHPPVLLPFSLYSAVERSMGFPARDAICATT